MARDVATLVAGAHEGRTRDIARLISMIEDGAPEVPAIMRDLAATSGHAQVIGITGSPGVGKSTTTAALISGLRARGERVGVLAVDPSSPFSGGALLGDRIRMQEHATDAGVFIRSMASRGHLGGLSATTPQALRVLDAAAFDTVLIETVGVGQSEVEVAAAADTTLVLLAPGMGDSIQAAKAGILEIGDVFVVNKADREGADSTVRELRNMIALGDHPDRGWQPRVVKTVASTGEGVDALISTIDEHRAWLAESGEGEQRRLRRARDEVEALAVAILHRRWEAGTDGGVLEKAAREVAAGRLDPHAAAEALVDGS
ncbi:MAG: methylmalonyl Co-A mutase-associated GTPase MeaB [Actinomycetales bacterium]|nr:methylmalonyl Co-A mutase-associated GTPase MeaB [Actinomycetales bacterium]